MGDKSPKSKSKNQGQKKGKTDAMNKEKNRMSESKRSVPAPAGGKKK